MKRIFSLVLLACVLLVGCNYEKTARDVIAASFGAITAAQLKYHDQCVAAPTVGVCVTITQAIGMQTLAIDALAAYCGFVPTSPATQTCAPLKAALPALQTAVANLNQITQDIQAVTK